MWFKAGLIGMLLLPLSAQADAVERLNSFFRNTQGMKASFQQTVLDSKGQKLQEVSGQMQLQRPGRFRWDYRKPYVQEVVGDGHKVWLYDPDLAQVTVRSLDRVLGSSPAALLAGSKDIDRLFTLSNASARDKLEWVQATPRDKDSGFDKVMLGFDGELLRSMRMYDSFGQETVIVFSNVERNPAFNAAVFKFTPPAGVDVLSE